MARGKTTVRAAVSLVLLVGFYLYALAVAAAVLGLGLLAVRAFGGLLSGKVMLAAAGAALAIFAGLVAALRRVTYPEDGMAVSRSEAPALWEFVDDTARRVGTRSVDELRLVPEVNAGVLEVTGLLGLKGGRRMLSLGIPLLAGLPTAELRSVLAHEFGHYAHVHTRLSAISHRGRMAITEVLDRLRRRAPYVSWMFAPYSAVYLAVQAAVSRRQELEADRASARIAGREAAMGSFAGLHLLDLAWSRFLQAEVTVGIPYGLVPRGICTGFGAYLDDLDTELRELADETPRPGPNPFDTHPADSVRLARLDRLGGEPETHDTGRAADLIPAALWARPGLDALVLEPGDRTVLDWEEFGPRMHLAYLRHLAEAGYRQIARVTGTAPASLESVLDMYDEGEGERWYREYVGPHFPEFAMTAIVLTAAYDSGALSFRHRWNDVLIVHTDGGEFADGPFFEHFDEAVEDLRPEGARRMRELLAGLGVDLAQAVGGTTGADAATAVYNGMESNMSFDGRPHDMAVTDEGIVLLPGPKSTEGARGRLAAYAEKYRPQELAALPGAVWIAYEHIVVAEVLRRAPLKWRLTLEDGRTHVLARGFLGETLGDPAEDLVRQIALRVRRPARQAD